MRVRRVGIVGPVTVGKTSLFDRLTLRGEHSVNIPGSTRQTTGGVLAVGVGAAASPFRRDCAACAASTRRSKRGRIGGCTVGQSDDQGCPGARGPRARGWPWRRPGRPQVGEKGDAEPAFRDVPLVVHLFDTPGSSNLAATSEDELVARDLLLSGDLDSVLFVADANSLRRSLALALQIAEFELPMVVALNMVDEAENMGVVVDDARLVTELGVGVVRTVAVDGYGVRKLSEALLDARVPKERVRLAPALEQAIERLRPLLENPLVPARALGLLLLSEDTGAARWVEAHLGAGSLRAAREIVAEVAASFRMPLGVLIDETYHTAAARLTERVATSHARGASLLARFGSMSQRPWPGALIALAVLTGAYYWVGEFAANLVVDRWIARLFEGYVVPACAWLVHWIPSDLVRDAIMAPDFGLLAAGLYAALGVVLPVLFCFYLLQALLEDSGYLPRLAILFDRLLRPIGLNGQSLIPLLLGFSCVAMSVLSARTLRSRKERTLHALLVVRIPCAPLLAVMLIILRRMPWTAGAVVGAVILARLVATGYVANRLMGGASPDFIVEVPRMRSPRLRIMLSKTWRRCWHFVQEALPLFMVAALTVFLFDRLGGLAATAAALRPVIRDLLGLPDAAVQVFIATAFRRQNGAALLNLQHAQFSHAQIVVTLLVMTFLVPCLNATILMVREHGLKVTSAILASAAVAAVAIGAAVHWLTLVLGVTFS